MTQMMKSTTSGPKLQLLAPFSPACVVSCSDPALCLSSQFVSNPVHWVCVISYSLLMKLTWDQLTQTSTSIQLGSVCADPHLAVSCCDSHDRNNPEIISRVFCVLKLPLEGAVRWSWMMSHKLASNQATRLCVTFLMYKDGGRVSTSSCCTKTKYPKRKQCHHQWWHHLEPVWAEAVRRWRQYTNFPPIHSRIIIQPWGKKDTWVSFCLKCCDIIKC